MITSANKSVGEYGEKLASNYLKKLKYNILFNNYRTTRGEIDIIAKKDNKLIFVEVKTRIGDKKGFPYESVNFYKIKHLKHAINLFLLKNKYKDYKLSIAVISIILTLGHEINSIKLYELDFY